VVFDAAGICTSEGECRIPTCPAKQQSRNRTLGFIITATGRYPGRLAGSRRDGNRRGSCVARLEVLLDRSLYVFESLGLVVAL
jgi:hypothetical protein